MALDQLAFAIECVRGEVPTVVNGDLWDLNDATTRDDDTYEGRTHRVPAPVWTGLHTSYMTTQASFSSLAPRLMARGFGSSSV